jgi:hypothetical protein
VGAECILRVFVNVTDVAVDVGVALVNFAELEFEVLVDPFVAVEQFVQSGDGLFLVITVTIHYLPEQTSISIKPPHCAPSYFHDSSSVGV